jgi:long-chain acyl-CoA synthetase
MSTYVHLVHHLLEETAQHHADRVAVIFQKESITFGQLNDLASRLAAYCVDRGVEPGDRVAMLCENSLAAVVAYFGILKAGGVVVSLNAESTPDNLHYMLRHSGAKALIARGRIVSTLGGNTLQDTAVRFCVVDGSSPPDHTGVPDFVELASVLAVKCPREPRIRRIDIDLESILYTSGSTGEPKGVMLSHLNTVSNMRSIAQYLGLTVSDRIMAVLPFSYVYGKSLLLTHVLMGGSVVIDNRFMYPNVVIDSMIETGVSGFAGVPSTFTILLARSKIREVKVPTLRYVTQAGGAMPAAVQKQVAVAFHPAELYVMYGATEAAPRLTYLDPADLPRKWGSIGKPVTNVDVFVADEQDKLLPCGETGEIVARGSNIMAGYWKDPEGTAAALRGGLYHTGDLGMVDSDGFLYVVGRKRDILKVRGYRVSCKAIEEALAGMDEVEETAVIGIPDAVLVEAPFAFVVLKPGQQVSERHIKQYLSSRLRPFEIPKNVEFRPGLPKNASGKIMKNQLTPSSRDGEEQPDRNAY